MILLGNLTIKEMESRLGIKFPDELVSYMEARHQENASKIAVGKWHCFDLPFNLVCGDMDTANEIIKHLAPLSADCKVQMQISLAGWWLNRRKID